MGEVEFKLNDMNDTCFEIYSLWKSNENAPRDFHGAFSLTRYEVEDLSCLLFFFISCPSHGGVGLQPKTFLIWVNCVQCH